MFVKENTVPEISNYFKNRLAGLYSDREVKTLVREFVCQRMNINTADWYLSQNILFSESDLLYFRSVVKRLEKNEPFQYVLGKTEFCGLELICDKRALIPRPETEELVVWAVDTIKDIKNPTIFDMCAGSGCIALSIKSMLMSAKVMAGEYSEEAIAQLRDNMEKTNLSLDIFSIDALNAGEYKQFEPNSIDCVVSNPPYIAANELQGMDANVVDYEPHMALFVPDSDPLVFYRTIVEECKNLVRNEGWYFFEIHEHLAEDMKEMLTELGLVNIELRKDLQEKPRMIRAQRVVSQHG